MYSLKVRGAVRKNAKNVPKKFEAMSDEAGASSSQASPAAGTPEAGTPKGSSSDDPVEQLSFSAGNPRVEHITGIVHLYRHLEEDAGPTTAFDIDQCKGRPSYADATASAPFAVPPNRSVQLCVLSLPPDMGFPEFCTFLGAYFGRVKEIRLVRRDSAAKATCLVLLKFDAQDAADGFFEDFNGKPFCMLEPEFVCRLLYVKDVELCEGSGGRGGSGIKEAESRETTTTTTSATTTALAHAPPPGTTELPSCPVCLERLDEHVSGIVTTVCNHQFHNQCLRQWGDTSCPVCRYCQHPTEGTSHCASCRSSADLWICLICGHVGCGRYRGSHAAAHWQESGHGYALELESQRVWDYASDAYVHRLIRSKTDGKLVEVPAPGGRGGECSVEGGECGEGCSREHNLSGLDPEVEEAMVLSKLDLLAAEYNHLLITQLDAQRQHFEGLLEKQQQESALAASEENAKATAALQVAGESAAAAAEAERRRRQLESKLADVSGQLEKSRKEKEFLKQLNDTLLANQKDFREKLKSAEKKAAEQNATIVDLQEQVRDLMVFIEAQQTIAAHGGSEVAGGTVLPMPEAPQRRSGGRKKK